MIRASLQAQREAERRYPVRVRDDGCGQQRHRTLFSRMLRSRMPLSPASVAATGSRRLRVPLPSVTMHGKHSVLRLFIRPPSRRFRPSK